MQRILGFAELEQMSSRRCLSLSLCNVNAGFVLETRHEARRRRRLPGIDDLMMEGVRMREA